jgi:hypothetical protein
MSGTPSRKVASRREVEWITRAGRIFSREWDRFAVARSRCGACRWSMPSPRCSPVVAAGLKFVRMDTLPRFVESRC